VTLVRGVTPLGGTRVAFSSVVTRATNDKALANRSERERGGW